MAQKIQSKGICAYCEKVVAKGSMTRHLKTCERRTEVIASAEQQERDNEVLYHLHVQDAYRKEFWLELEVSGSRTLKVLDNYLRYIWLECCGHLSQFSIGGWRGEEISISRKIGQVFQYVAELTHIYDYGTSSFTLIKVAGVREGKPTTKHPVALMARNVMPESICIECGQPAAYLCMECVIEEDTWGLLCEEHAETHPHNEYGTPIPLVNSPRLGMCGYTGPADPPY